MLNRREFCKSGIIATSLLYTLPSLGKERLIELKITARPTKINSLEGQATNYWKLFVEQLSGPNAIESIGVNSYLSNTIRVKRGDRLKIKFVNELPEKSIIHWHGLHLPENQDGHPMYAVESGSTYSYDFIVDNRPGTYWFHPHPHSRTGHQVYHGMAGLFIVEDDQRLPDYEYDIPLVLQDREFDENNQLIYVRNRHDQMMGMHGRTMLLNGAANGIKRVDSGMYRLRILNGSNARIYNLAWSDERPLKVIGTDGGLLPKKNIRKTCLLAPGERIELLVDFSRLVAEEEIKLISAPIIEGRGSSYPIATFVGTGKQGWDISISNEFETFEKIDLNEAVNSVNPKVIELTMSREFGWSFDNQNYSMRGANEKETVRLGDTEVWKFSHTKFGMAHPIHMHGDQFQIIQRTSSRFKDLTCDLGWKDTVLLLPGDEVTVIKRFRDYKGLFLYHCHNLEHEDQAMMRNYMRKLEVALT